MKTFDYQQVDAVLSPLKARLNDCAHGEGDQCETLDSHLDCCATICFQVVESLKAWALSVFAGEVIFEAAVEDRWRTEVAQIYTRATAIWQSGRSLEVPCYQLPGLNNLQSGLWELQWLLENWVSPRRSVAPLPRARMQFTTEQKAGIRDQLAALPPLGLENPMP